MNKKIVYAVFISVLGLSLFAAGQKESHGAEKSEREQQHTRIVNLSPPVYSMLLTFPQLADSVVGVNPRTFSTSNPQVLHIVNPSAKNIDTSFVNNDFTINVESLASLQKKRYGLLITTYLQTNNAINTLPRLTYRRI